MQSNEARTPRQGQAVWIVGALLVVAAVALGSWRLASSSGGNRAVVSPGTAPLPPTQPVRWRGPPPGQSRSEARFARGFGDVSQTNASDGTLSVSSAHPLEGGATGHASYDGSGRNGYARAIFNVDWHAGDDVYYSTWLYLPSSLFDSLRGQLAVMRWDDFPEHPNDPQQTGVVINGRDLQADLETEILGRSRQVPLSGEFDLPKDRWFWLGVHQRLGGGAINEVFVDGQLIGGSTLANLAPGRSVLRVRYGVVAIAQTAQLLPLELWFDRATASPGAVP